jgi:hypothetical protein
MPVWEMPLWEMPVWEMPVREMPVWEMLVREMPVREMPVREMPVWEMPVWSLGRVVCCYDVLFIIFFSPSGRFQDGTFIRPQSVRLVPICSSAVFPFSAMQPDLLMAQ